MTGPAAGNLCTGIAERDRAADDAGLICTASVGLGGGASLRSSGTATFLAPGWSVGVVALADFAAQGEGTAELESGWAGLE